MNVVKLNPFRFLEQKVKAVQTVLLQCSAAPVRRSIKELFENKLVCIGIQLRCELIQVKELLSFQLQSDLSISESFRQFEKCSEYFTLQVCHLLISTLLPNLWRF